MRIGPSARFALLTSVVVGTGLLTASPAHGAVVTPVPSSWANTATAQVVSFSTSSALLYSVGSTMSIVGPGGSSDTYDATDVTSNPMTNTVSGTFDMVTDGVLAAPGAYALSAGVSFPLPETIDTATVTITNTQPTITASGGGHPGESVPFEIDATSGAFAKGDTVLFEQNNVTSSDVTMASPTIAATSLTGTLSIGSNAAPGTYDVAVLDTAGSATVCTACVTVDAGPNAVVGLAPNSVKDTTAGLAWSDPSADATHPAPASYDIVVSTDASATTTDSGVMVSHGAGTASASLSGLTPGTKYYATVTGVSASGPGVPTQVSFFTNQPVHLTIGREPAAITYGSHPARTKLTLTGMLSLGTSATGAGVAGQSVGLWAEVNKKVAKIATVQTDSHGNYTYTFSPKKAAIYAAYFNGAPSTASGAALDTGIALTKTVTVTPGITLKGTAKHHGQWLQLSGQVRPGEAGKTVTIYVVKGHQQTKFKTLKLSARSTYSMLLKHVTAPTTVYVAKIAAHNGLQAATSPTLKVTVS